MHHMQTGTQTRLGTLLRLPHLDWDMDTFVCRHGQGWEGTSHEDPETNAAP